jgi:hypothetical protein
MTDVKPKKKPPGPKQAAFVKLTHAITIVSLVIMIGSGLRIYNANPVFGGRGGWVFPKAWVLGGGLSDARNFASIYSSMGSISLSRSVGKSGLCLLLMSRH